MEQWKYLIIPLISVILAQGIKFGIESIREKKWMWSRLFNGNGGMPSSHTAFTFSIVMAIGLGEGFTSPLFAVSLVFACIVGYDAMGLRMESGKQAVRINELWQEVFSKKRDRKITKLKEQLGHKPLEVLMGVFLGGIVAILFMNFLQ